MGEVAESYAAVVCFHCGKDLTYLKNHVFSCEPCGVYWSLCYYDFKQGTEDTGIVGSEMTIRPAKIEKRAI